LAYLFVWLVATGATMGASWLGLRSVLDVATPHRATPLSAADLRRSSGPSPVASGSPKAHPNPAPAEPTPSKTTDWVQVSGSRLSPSFQRTFHLVGGDVTVLASPWDVRVVSEKPKPGYVFVENWVDLRTIVVEFTEGSKVSKVVVSWRDGPTADVTETGT
jgi:hypothetical protein